MPSLCLPTTQFDTVGSEDPIGMWRDRMSTAYEVSVPSEAQAGFRSAYRGWSLGPVAITSGMKRW